MLDKDLRYFKLSEFKHPELINPIAAELLDEIRHQYGRPLVVTDDARTPMELPTGTPGPGKSLHYVGQAFDLRSRGLSREDLWKLVVAVINVATWVARGAKRGVELEIVNSSTDQHVHVGFFLGDGRENRLLVKAE